MYLRDLTVELSDLAELPAGYSARQFHDSTHAVVEPYLDRLPRRKVKLAEAAKVILQVGPRSPGGIPVKDGFVVYPGAVGFLWLHDVGLDLDLPTYARSDRPTQQRMLLETLHAGLLEIARRTGDDATWFERAYEQLKTGPFPFPEIPDDELLRRWGLLPKPIKRRKAAVGRKTSTQRRKSGRKKKKA